VVVALGHDEEKAAATETVKLVGVCVCARTPSPNR